MSACLGRGFGMAHVIPQGEKVCKACGAPAQEWPLKSKPLHVRVAEAVGWTLIEPPGYVSPITLGGYTFDRWTGVLPGTSERVSVWQYDLNWSSAGPLIEKHGISLATWEESSLAFIPSDLSSGEVENGFTWLDGQVYPAADGETPLIAVCNLLVLMGSEGLL